MEIELTYGVLDVEMSIPKEDASDITSCRSSRALDVPCDDAKVLKDSSMYSEERITMASETPYSSRDTLVLEFILEHF